MTDTQLNNKVAECNALKRRVESLECALEDVIDSVEDLNTYLTLYFDKPDVRLINKIAELRIDQLWNLSHYWKPVLNDSDDREESHHDH